MRACGGPFGGPGIGRISTEGERHMSFGYTYAQFANEDWGVFRANAYNEPRGRAVKVFKTKKAAIRNADKMTREERKERAQTNEP